MMVDHALQYAGRGWRIFPIKPLDKKPLTKHGFKDASVSPSIIEAWWKKYPTANIGLATGQASGLVVLDVDGQEGFESLDKLLAHYNGKPMPYTEIVRTSRGIHIYFALPQGERLPCSTGQGIEKGLDVRGDGGYVILPPSIHPSGHVYEWVVQADYDAVNA